MNRRGFAGKLAAVFAAPFAFFFGRQTQASPRPLQMATATLKPISRPKLRIWKLGNLEKGTLPTHESMKRLSEIINDWGGKSDFDLIWGPDLEMQQVDLDSGDIDIIIPPDAEVNVLENKEGEQPQIKIIRQ